MSAIEFDGILNFRDFGGMPGAGGRLVKRGLLFRSGHHAAASDADMARLADMDFALIVDLRRTPERLREIARRVEDGRHQMIEHQGPSEAAVPPHLAALQTGDIGPDDIARQMIVGYRGYPFDPYYIAIYREYFAKLGEVDGPVLIQCHAGKDRTGVLCALTLHVLGVERPAIYEDYLATNIHNRADARMNEMAENYRVTYGRTPSDEFLRKLMSVEAAYLDAAYDAIAEGHGDIDAYLRDVVKLDSATAAAIRANLLE